jgi:enamine deaminase RidA (YjgF/YER057c/UK114 family)
MPTLFSSPKSSSAHRTCYEVFGKDAALHARSAVGMHSLPRGNCVEIETILEFE